MNIIGKMKTILGLAFVTMLFLGTFYAYASDEKEECSYGGIISVLSYSSPEMALYGTQLQEDSEGNYLGQVQTSLLLHSDRQPSITMLKAKVVYEDETQNQLISFGTMSTNVRVKPTYNKIKKIVSYHKIDAGTYRKYEYYTGATYEME